MEPISTGDHSPSGTQRRHRPSTTLPQFARTHRTRCRTRPSGGKRRNFGPMLIQPAGATGRRFARVAIALVIGAVLASCSSTVASDAVPDTTPISATVPPPTAASPTTTPTVAPATDATSQPVADEAQPVADEPRATWTRMTEHAEWEPRAGLRVLASEGALLLLGGRTPNNSTIPGDSRIWSDVWRSDDLGRSWVELLGSDLDHWAPRAYFQAVEKDGFFYVLGGQDYGLEPNPFCELLEQGFEPPPGLGIDPDAPCPEFFPTSQFFNDVWRSSDGVSWEQMTAAAPWEPRAGLSAAVLGDYIYVLGGSQNDDSSIIGANGPERLYFNDVWRSADGAVWEQMVAAAPWEPRAGGALVAFNDALFLLGGEDGFTCSPVPDCEAPYFNDVWRSTDGASWQLVTEAAGWSPRPGHVCKPLDGDLVCFGGFGLVDNPLDVWRSADGEIWSQLAGPPWNAEASDQAKYDFDAVSVVLEDQTEVVLTFGGDRETFDFDDPDNWLRIDDDVWQLSLD